MSKPIALVTGASSGIGAEFCRQLAPRCQSVILVGRRRAQLDAVAAQVRAQGAEAHVVIADLADPIGVTRVQEAIRQQGPVTMLVNNAGFSTLGTFAELDLEPQQAMVDVHITATLALCRAAIPFMQQAGGGTIINLSSLASLFPMRGVAVYCATKAFLNAFSEGLQQEVKNHGIKVQCLLPGYTRTEFHDRDAFTGFDKAAVPEDMWMSSADVVRESLDALASEQVMFIAGETNRALANG